MKEIGQYLQLTEFTTENAGTAEWCKAKRDGKEYFVKRFLNPVYPSKELGLSDRLYRASVEAFHKAFDQKEEIYRRLRECDSSGTLVIPVEVINYQYHICTIAEFVTGNVAPEEIHLLSEWQRLVLMRTLTVALMNVHQAGIVHSDMKPENVLITQDPEGNCKLRLIDFDGSFLETDPPEDPEDVVGDPAFFAPEAYLQSMEEGIRLDHRIDIFALGLIFHFFWTGKYPDRPDYQAIGVCLLKDEEITLSKEIPTVLQKLIQRMLTKDPDSRIDLKSVYDVLGVQINRHTREIVNLGKAGPGGASTGDGTTTTGGSNMADVRIEYVDDDGKVLKFKDLKIPYGSSQTVKAEKIKGYYLNETNTKIIQVLSNGYVKTPVTFNYRKELEDSNSDRAKAAVAVIITILVVLLMLYFFFNVAKGCEQERIFKQPADIITLCNEPFQSD